MLSCEKGWMGGKVVASYGNKNETETYHLV